MAFQKIQQSGESTLRVFSFEKLSDHSRGARRYIVSSYVKFWKWYRTLQSGRHYYELIREHSPSKLYFDLEFEPSFNPNVDGIAALRLFLDHLYQSLQQKFGKARSARTIIDLSSSNASKFSHHLVVTNVVFCNNIEMGYYVKHLLLELYRKLKGEHDARMHESGERTVSHFEMLFPLNSEGERRPIVDTSVYTKNRNFRLWKSSKLGKTTEFHVGELDELFATTDEADYFYNTLICHLAYPYNALPYMTFAEKAKELYSMSAVGTASIPGVPIPFSLQIKLPRTSRPTLGHVASGDVSFGTQSPLAELDSFVSAELCSWPGNSRPILRSWRLLEDVGILTYNIGNNRYCERIQREHKSNHIFIVCYLRKRIWSQSCHDPECRAMKFESAHRPIPWNVDIPGYDAFEELDKSIQLTDFDPDEVARTAPEREVGMVLNETTAMGADYPVHEWEMDFDPDAFVHPQPENRS